MTKMPIICKAGTMLLPLLLLWIVEMPSSCRASFISKVSTRKVFVNILPDPLQQKSKQKEPHCGLFLGPVSSSFLRRGCRYVKSKDNNNDDDDDDPWAGNRLYTDENDTLEEEEEEEDELAWLDQIPGARDNFAPPKQPAAASEALNTDTFYSSFDDEKFLQMQKEYSAKARNMTVEEYENWTKDNQKQTMDASDPNKIYGDTQDREKKSTTIQNLSQHLEVQAKTFDEKSDFFNSDQAVPDDLPPVLKHMMNRLMKQMKECRAEGLALKQQNKNKDTGDQQKNTPLPGPTKDTNTFRVLDVGCGTGALFPYYLEAANQANMELQIFGVDLSPKMSKFAKINSELSLDEKGGRHSFEIETSDFVELILGKKDDESSTINQQHQAKYDAVVINACFGNFYNQDDVLKAATEALKVDGVLAITHPLGAAFVVQLNEENPDMVPHHLPSILDFRRLSRSYPLTVLDFIEDVDLLDAEKNVKNYKIYYACAKKSPHTCLKQIIRLRGTVDQGYGRGGKKLGFPTANLPSSLFADALENVQTGVYFGWAVIEDQECQPKTKKGRNTFHKAVVNVGYSPTFDGEENKEKIVEAHLILDDSTDIRGDFYNETMRLALSGFLRPEMKFASFPDLIAAINNDLNNAKNALSLQPFAALRTDSFLTEPCRRINNTMVEDGVTWVGKDGGDEEASWEFEDIQDAIADTPLGRWAV